MQLPISCTIPFDDWSVLFLFTRVLLLTHAISLFLDLPDVLDSCSFLLSWSWSLLAWLVLTGQEDAERIAPLHPAKAASLIRILLQVQNGADTGNYNWHTEASWMPVGIKMSVQCTGTIVQQEKTSWQGCNVIEQTCPQLLSAGSWAMHTFPHSGMHPAACCNATHSSGARDPWRRGIEGGTKPWEDIRASPAASQTDLHRYTMIKGSLGGETSVLRTFRMSGKELVKERVSQRNS